MKTITTANTTSEPKGKNKKKPKPKIPTVTKKMLIDRIAEATGQKRVAVRDTVQAFLDEINSELTAGNRLEFRGFGVFEVRNRAARMAQNPKTLEQVPVPAKRIVKFKPGRTMRESIEGQPAAVAEIHITPGAAESLDGQAPALRVNTG